MHKQLYSLLLIAILCLSLSVNAAETTGLSKETKNLIIVIITIVAIVLILVATLFYVRKRKSVEQEKQPWVNKTANPQAPQFKATSKFAWGKTGVEQNNNQQANQTQTTNQQQNPQPTTQQNQTNTQQQNSSTPQYSQNINQTQQPPQSNSYSPPSNIFVPEKLIQKPTQENLESLSALLGPMGTLVAQQANQNASFIRTISQEEERTKISIIVMKAFKKEEKQAKIIERLPKELNLNTMDLQSKQSFRLIKGEYLEFTINTQDDIAYYINKPIEQVSLKLFTCPTIIQIS